MQHLKNEEIHKEDMKELMESAAILTAKYNENLESRIKDQRKLVRDVEEKKALEAKITEVEKELETRRWRLAKSQ